MSDFALLSYIADIRQKSGVGMKPMLSELADAIAAALTTARANGRADGMEEAARIIDHLNGWGSDNGRGGHAEHFASAIRKAKDNGE